MGDLIGLSSYRVSRFFKHSREQGVCRVELEVGPTSFYEIDAFTSGKYGVFKGVKFSAVYFGMNKRRSVVEERDDVMQSCVWVDRQMRAVQYPSGNNHPWRPLLHESFDRAIECVERGLETELQLEFPDESRRPLIIPFERDHTIYSTEFVKAEIDALLEQESFQSLSLDEVNFK